MHCAETVLAWHEHRAPAELCAACLSKKATDGTGVMQTAETEMSRLSFDGLMPWGHDVEQLELKLAGECREAAQERARWQTVWLTFRSSGCTGFALGHRWLAPLPLHFRHLYGADADCVGRQRQRFLLVRLTSWCEADGRRARVSSCRCECPEQHLQRKVWDSYILCWTARMALGTSLRETWREYGLQLLQLMSLVFPAELPSADVQAVFKGICEDPATQLGAFRGSCVDWFM